MKRVVTIVLILVIIFGLCGCTQEKTVNISEEEIRGICDLATLECYYNNVAKLEKEADNIFQKDRKMWIEYEGKATIGIDMANVAIQVNGNNVKIKMPKAEILSIDYTFNEDSYISSADGWLAKNEISTEEQQEAVVAAQKAMEQAIMDNKGLFVKAESRAKELIENYILKIGEVIGVEYVIEWDKN